MKTEEQIVREVIKARRSLLLEQAECRKRLIDIECELETLEFEFEEGV